MAGLQMGLRHSPPTHPNPGTGPCYRLRVLRETMGALIPLEGGSLGAGPVLLVLAPLGQGGEGGRASPERAAVCRAGWWILSYICLSVCKP